MKNFQVGMEDDNSWSIPVGRPLLHDSVQPPHQHIIPALIANR